MVIFCYESITDVNSETQWAASRRYCKYERSHKRGGSSVHYCITRDPSMPTILAVFPFKPKAQCFLNFGGCLVLMTTTHSNFRFTISQELIVQM